MTLKIIDNGTFPISANSNVVASTIHVKGAIGGATVVINNHGQALLNGSFTTTPFDERINHGTGSSLELVVTGGTAIDLDVEFNPYQKMSR